MKNVPISYLILVLLLIFSIGCRNQKEKTIRPGIDNTAPQEELRDSNNSTDTTEMQIPGDQAPGRAKKNSNSKLDTLRPIKA